MMQITTPYMLMLAGMTECVYNNLMSQERRQPEPRFDRYLLNEYATSGILKEAVKFTELYSMTPRMTEALKLESILPFLPQVPSLDSAIVKDYAEGMTNALHFFGEDIDALKKAKTNYGEIDPFEYDKYRRNLSHPDVQRRPQNFQESIDLSTKLGLRQSRLLGAMTDAFHLATAHIYKDDPNFNSRTVFLTEEEAAMLELQASVSEAELAERLEELGHTDLSQQNLNKWFEYFEAVAQFELLRFILHDFRDIVQYSSEKFSASGQYLAEAAKELIAADDMNEKLKVALKVMQMFEGLSQSNSTAQPVQKRKVLQLMSARLETITESFFEEIYLVNIVYRRKCLQAPSRLQSLTTKTMQRFVDKYFASDKPTEPQQADDRSSDKHKAQETVREHFAVLSEQIKAANNRWHVSSKARKNMGLKDIPKYLLQGFRAADRSEVKFSIPDGDIPPVLNLIVKLHEMTEKAHDVDELKAIHAQLAAAIRLQAELDQQRTTLHREARTHALHDLILPEVVKLRVHITQITEQWAAFEKLIQEKWPQNGQRIAASIKAILEIET